MQGKHSTHKQPKANISRKTCPYNSSNTV